MKSKTKEILRIFGRAALVGSAFLAINLGSMYKINSMLQNLYSPQVPEIVEKTRVFESEFKRLQGLEQVLETRQLGQNSDVLPTNYLAQVGPIYSEDHETLRKIREGSKILMTEIEKNKNSKEFQAYQTEWKEYQAKRDLLQTTGGAVMVGSFIPLVLFGPRYIFRRKQTQVGD